MSDLLHNVSLLRKSLQKKRLLRNKELSLNMGPLSLIENDRSKTERNQRKKNASTEKSQLSEIGIASPMLGKRFEFIESLASPSRIRSYKIDAANLLFSRLKRFINKHFLIWKKNSELLRNEESRIFNQKAWRLKVSVGKLEPKAREIVKNASLAGKIVRKSQENISNFMSKYTSSIDLNFDDDAPIIEVIQEDKQKSYTSSIDNLNSFSAEKNLTKFSIFSRFSQKNNNLRKFLNLLKKILLRRFGFCVKKIRLWEGFRRVFKNLCKNRCRTVLEIILKSEEIQKNRNSVKENLEGCIKNLQNYITIERDKKTKKSKNLDLKRIKNSGDRLDLIFTKSLLFSSFLKLKEYTSYDFVWFTETLDKIIRSFHFELKNYSFTQIKLYPKTLKKHERVLKKLMKNLNKDLNYRTEACFNYWKSFTKICLKKKEFSSLSAITVTNLLLNIINCRTKSFFITYSLALSKHKNLTHEKIQNIKKGTNRLILFIKDHLFKFFFNWKIFTKACTFQLSGKKKFINNLETKIMRVVVEKLRNSFNHILVHINFKKSAIRVIKKYFYKKISQDFNFFRSIKSFSNIEKSPTSIKKSFAMIKGRMSLSIIQKKPRKFTFQYLCHSLFRLSSILVFHHNSLKKNTMVKWKVDIINTSKLQSLKLRYDKERNHTLPLSWR